MFTNQNRDCQMHFRAKDRASSRPNNVHTRYYFFNFKGILILVSMPYTCVFHAFENEIDILKRIFSYACYILTDSNVATICPGKILQLPTWVCWESNIYQPLSLRL